jgi:MFS superfamily sulfate permease-like transporter
MIELYRGLIDILIYVSRLFDEQLTRQIRERTEFDFWNFMLEIVFMLFSKAFLVSGIMLCMALAIVFFPLHVVYIFLNTVLNARAEYIEPEPINIEPIVEKNNGNTKKEK